MDECQSRLLTFTFANAARHRLDDANHNRVREHLITDKASNVFRHLKSSPHCRSLCSVDCFKILDHASTEFQLKIKEAIHIKFEKPSLNAQVHHVNLKLSV